MREKRKSQSSRATTLSPAAGQARSLGGNVQDRPPVGVVDGVENFDRRAVGEEQAAAIARLAAAAGVKDRGVEDDSAAPAASTRASTSRR